MGCTLSNDTELATPGHAKTMFDKNQIAQQREVDESGVKIKFSQSNKARESEVQTIYGLAVLEENKVSWKDLKFDVTKKDTILGFGMFGVVLRATWTPKDSAPMDVAVKLFIQSTENKPEDEYLAMCSAAYDEMEVMRRAEKYMGSCEYIVKTHGLLMGSIPKELVPAFDLHQDGVQLSGVGIVMRNEAGGSLANLIYNKKNQTVPLQEKIRILSEIAKGLSDLHASGIVHADIKPANILLSGDLPSKVRLADFGLAIIRARNLNASNLLRTTLALSDQTQGTPVYYAPEMLYDPFVKEGECREIARPSRKTDMYAFALLCWQTLTQKKLFPDITTESVLATLIHRGHRPPLDELRFVAPPVVVDMIMACWSRDRSKRKTASQCHLILEECFDKVSPATANTTPAISPAISPRTPTSFNMS